MTGTLLRIVLPLIAVTYPVLVAGQTNRHPDPRFLQSPRPPSFRASLTDPASQPPFRLRATPTARFGDESDSEATLLGDILAASFLPDGGVAILDDKLAHLRIFDRSARPLETVGRAGQGPGEFAGRLLSLATDFRAQILVADLSRSLKFYHHTSTGYQYSRAVPLGLSPRAMCLLDSSLVALGPIAGRPEALHTFRLDGTKVRDFGALYESPNTWFNYQFVVGRLACDPDRHLAYFALETGFGEIRAYRADGQLIWRTAIDGFLSNIIEDLPRGYQVLPSPHGVHTVRSLTLLPQLGLLLQVGHRTRADLDEGAWYSTLTSFLLDPDSGQPVCLGTTLPLIVAARGEQVLVIGEDPVPHFEIHALTAP